MPLLFSWKSWKGASVSLSSEFCVEITDPWCPLKHRSSIIQPGDIPHILCSCLPHLVMSELAIGQQGEVLFAYPVSGP
ncbi:hypothetical protein Ancab_024374 [Ancistrocladus abbreviatus]